jgi:outer membrane protein assembly factor BamB
MHRFTKSILTLLSIAVVFGVASAPVLGDDWPQWLGPQRDGVWRESGIVDRFPSDGPPVRWRAPIGGGYAGPAVAGGRVYVTDRVLAEGVRNPDNPFQRGSIAGKERVLCLDDANGQVVWKHEYDCSYTVSYPAGPRTTPVVVDGKVWTLGSEGDLFCFETATGKVVWHRDLKKDFGVGTPVWGFSSNPLVDGNKLICLVGGEGSAAVAFDKSTGKELWRSLSVEGEHGPGYCPPMIYEAGGVRQLIVWHPTAVNSLDPETGKVHWSQEFKLQSGLSIPTPRKLGDNLFVTSFYNGPMMFKLDGERPAATLLWRGESNNERRTDKLHAIMSTPYLEDGHIYGVCSYGQLRCLKMDTGERVWETIKPTGATGERGGQGDRWCNAFLVKHEDRFFLANEKGELIIARLSPKGYDELSRAPLIEPTNFAMGRNIVWSHPAFANRSVYLRNDKEIACFSLAAEATAR